MRPVVALASDTNPNYLFLLPIVVKSWWLQGFDPTVYIVKQKNEDVRVTSARIYVMRMIEKSGGKAYTVPHDQKGFSSATTAQIIRLYMPLEFAENKPYIILGDADMMIASNFLYRDFHKVNVFGHDLTGRQHVPMCYVGAPFVEWCKIIGEKQEEGKPEPDHLSDLIDYADIHSKEAGKAWGADQDILTAKLKIYGYDKINFIDRGTDPDNSNLPIGRVDRYNNLRIPIPEMKDIHLPKSAWEEEVFKNVIEVCQRAYPREGWNWLQTYRDEFEKELFY